MKSADRIRSSDVLILVAPVQGRSWLDFGRVTLIKANWLEATEAVGHHAVNPLAWARRLADNHHYHMVVDIWSLWNDLRGAGQDASTTSPAVHANVTDICGAGDTVIATLAVALARNNPLLRGLPACRDGGGAANQFDRRHPSLDANDRTLLQPRAAKNTCEYVIAINATDARGTGATFAQVMMMEAVFLESAVALL
ncbi:MAG: hypothetical protein KatS3mg082_1993 [Nitrospiraceae bacterium]|nr:MAG: hypothetical protein KatS3mg082_1993 [Nitrospiraceae bacterium]